MVVNRCSSGGGGMVCPCVRRHGSSAAVAVMTEPLWMRLGGSRCLGGAGDGVLGGLGCHFGLLARWAGAQAVHDAWFPRGGVGCTGHVDCLTIEV